MIEKVKYISFCSYFVAFWSLFLWKFNISLLWEGENKYNNEGVSIEASDGILQIETHDLHQKELLNLAILALNDRTIHREAVESVITFEPDGTSIHCYYPYLVDKISWKSKIKDGHLEPVHERCREGMEELYKKTGALLANALNAVFNALDSNVYASNLTASSNNPTLYFDYPYNNGYATWGDNEWDIDVGSASNDSCGRFFIRNWRLNQDYLIFEDTDFDATSSIHVYSNGDLGLSNNGIYIDRSLRNVGIGIATPEFRLDVVGNGIRLRESSSSTAHELLMSLFYDNYNLIRSENEKLYLRADPYDIHINPFGGNVAIGTSSEPTEKLSVNGNIKGYFSGIFWGGDGLKKLVQLSSNNTASNRTSDAGFSIINSNQGFAWNFRTYEPSQGFAATKDGTGGTEFELRNTTNNYQNVSLHLGNGAYCSSTGQWINASSREYKENIEPLDGKTAREVLESLEPVTFNFKRDESKRKNIGFIAEEMPEILSVPDKKGVNALEVVALLTKVVKEQEKIITEQKKAIAKLKEEQKKSISKLKERVLKLEQEIRTQNMLSSHLSPR